MVKTRVELETALEALIDCHELAEVIDAISSVCIQKSSHLQQNWSDEQAAKSWLAASLKLNSLARKI